MCQDEVYYLFMTSLFTSKCVEYKQIVYVYKNMPNTHRKINSMRILMVTNRNELVKDVII